jgi:hypothetical protein
MATLVALPFLAAGAKRIGSPYRPESFGFATLPHGLSLVLTFLPKG